MSDDVELLGTDETNRIVDLARACKAAQRSVLLYPQSHPAIAATLGRIVQTTSVAALGGAMTIAVLPDDIRIGGRKPAREDEAVAAFARLLHEHLVGEITIHPGADKDAWFTFLQLLGRAPDELRAEGGISRVWTTMAGRHVELREIDYTEVLRERQGSLGGRWDEIVANCLEGTTSLSLDDEMMTALAALAEDGDRIAELMGAVDERSSGGVGAKSAAIMRMIRSFVKSVSAKQPEMLDAMLRNVASAVGQLTPELLIGLLAEDAAVHADTGEDKLMESVVSHMSEKAIAGFVSRNVIAEGTPTDRLAQAFQALVNETQDRERLLSMAKTEVAASPLGGAQGFDAVWTHVAQKLLTSYADKSFVSDPYARELSTARAHAIDVERVGDDPPDRVTGWLTSVSTTAVRTLDISLLVDLLRIEKDDARWGELMAPVVHTVEDLLLVGDFDSAAMEKTVRAALEAWPRGPAFQGPPASFRREARPGVFLAAKSDVNQSSVRLSHVGTTRNNPDFFALEVMNQIFGGGFASRLFSEVRSRQGLAYEVWGGVGAEYDYPGMFLVGMGTKSSTTAQGIRALQAEIDRLQREPPDAKELASAREAIVNSFVFRYDSKEKVLREQMRFAFFGYPADFLERYRAGVEKVTAADVLRVARKYVRRNELSILVVGNPGEIKGLESIGRVQRIDISIPGAK